MLARSRAAALGAALVLVHGLSWAQEQTVAIEGVVRDPTGSALAGVDVSLRGDKVSLEEKTDAAGTFAFRSLPPGRYSILALAEGVGSAEPQPLDVRLGPPLRLEIEIAPPVAESLEVVAARETIGATGAAFSTTLTRETLDRIPSDRDFLSTVKQIQGVNEESSLAGVSIDGASGAENRVYIDGIDTTSPQKGIPAKELPADFASEIQVKSAGYAAEFGGSTGGVINALTRTGSNEFRASLGLRYESNEHSGEPRAELGRDESGTVPVYSRFRDDDIRRTDPSLSSSGPLVRDHAWFYLGYEQGERRTTREIGFITGERGSFEERLRMQFLALNVVVGLGERGFAKLAVHASPSETDGALPAREGRGSADPGDYRVGDERDNEAAILSVDLQPGRSWLFSARGGRFETDYRTTGITKTGFEKVFQNVSPSVFLEAPPDLVRPVGFTTGPIYTLWDRDEYRRSMLQVDATHHLSGFGDHDLKAGAQLERIENSVLRDASATNLEFQWNIGDAVAGEIARGRYGALAASRYQTTGEVRTDNLALFLQDSWRPLSNLTIEAGLRAESEEIPDYRIGHEGENAIKFELDEKLAPRLGFAWDPFRSGKTRVYGSYGRYFDVTKYELARLSFGSERRVRYTYRLNTLDWTSVNCEILTNDPARPPDCGPGVEFATAVNLRNPSNEAIDPDLRPTESEEWQAGFDRQLTSTTTVGFRYLRKELERVIEDIGAYVEGVGEVYVIGNPGEGPSRFALAGVPLPRPVRDYDALELALRRRWSGNWSLAASYTYSRLEGNFPGLASSDEGGRAAPNVLRVYDGWFNLFGENGQPVEGPLPTDRPHQLEISAAWRAPWGTTAGIYQYAASGTPLSTVAYRNHVPFYPYGRGDLGRSPTLTQTDLRLEQEIPFEHASLSFAVTVLNLFDEDTLLSVQARLHAGTLGLSDEDFLGGFDVRERAAAQGLPVLPDYRLPSAFQAPRRVLFSMALKL